MIDEIYDVGYTFKPVKNGQGQLVHMGSERIGDRLIFSALPEMVFEQTGKKVVDLDPKGFNWFWDNNPFVVRDEKVKRIVPLQLIADQSTHGRYYRNLPNFLSIVDKYCSIFGLECTIRHPKLYKYENEKRNPKKVILTTQGALDEMMGGEMYDRILSDEIIEQIKNNYKEYDIIQIGSKGDKDAGVIDKRGLSIWESVKEVSEASIYIGVNTGVMWIASCYPHIAKKVILCQYSEESLKYFIPMNVDDHHTVWCDYSNQFFNATNRDIGITTSYLKI